MLTVFFALLLALSVSAADAPRFDVPVPPPVDAKAAIVLDMANGDVLFEYDADVIIPPASLTKIMSMMVALDAVQAGKVSLDQRIEILWDDVNLPYRSSLMYLREGMQVPFDQLLRGMAVVSGNDAARTVARVVAGSSDRFVEMMNDEAGRLGLVKTHFVEPSGLSELNTSTAREIALLARYYMLRYPESLERYHSRTSMEFPTADVVAPGDSMPRNRIVLRSTNDLLFSYDGCDGLKTGFIDESGYNLVATAERNGTRIISVTMGGVGGVRGREKSGATLLDWSFSNWKTVKPDIPIMPAVRSWGGATETVQLELDGSNTFTVPRQLAGSIVARLEIEALVKAPVLKGQKLGRIVYTSGDRIVRRMDLVSSGDVPLGNIFIRMRDAVILFFKQLFQKN